MGWCHAFGPQIQAGCDHAMVANAASCSCPECKVVCTGKFSGCSTVWAAGPQPVTFRRPTRDMGRPAAQLALTARSNGWPGPSPEPELPTRRLVESSFGPDSYSDLRPLLNALRAEVQVLSRKLDQIQPSEPEPLAGQRALAVVEALPERVAKVAVQAMRTHHETSLRDLRDIAQRIERSIESAGPRPDPPDGPDQPLTRGELDARFSWLVDELSDRLVILGNEIARIDRQQVAGSNGGPVANGHAEKPAAPSGRRPTDSIL